MLKKVVLMGAATAVLGLAGQAVAETAASTTTFKARIVISRVCNVTTVAPTDLDFGTNDAGAVNVDATSLITVTCSKTTPYDIGLSTATGSVGTGVMASAAADNTDEVAYTMYQDAARTKEWGNTIGTNTQHGTGKGLAATAPADKYTVYGRAASTDVRPGAYEDTVTVTLTY